MAKLVYNEIILKLEVLDGLYFNELMVIVLVKKQMHVKCLSLLLLKDVQKWKISLLKQLLTWLISTTKTMKNLKTKLQNRATDIAH